MYQLRLLLLLAVVGCSTIQDLSTQSTLAQHIQHQTLQSTSFFESVQSISLVEIPVSFQQTHTWELAFSKDTLKKTSQFAQAYDAQIAINGGFFDMKKGGSVTYLEADNQVINFSFKEEEKWAKPSNITNGALIISSSNTILIEPNQGDSHYQQSNKEKAVLITGPMLLYKGKRSELQDVKFNTARHPRSCVCELASGNILLVTVDGRSKTAAGMSLLELQEFLLYQNCKNAINLDGGGSTTLWRAGEGILNTPSDRRGERKVANVLLLRKGSE